MNVWRLWHDTYMSGYIARWCLNTTASTQFTWPFKPSSPCTHRVSSQVSPSTIQCLCLFAFLFYPFYSVKQVEQLINRDVTYSTTETISRRCRRLRRWRNPHLPGLRGLRSAPSDQEARYCRWPSGWWLIVVLTMCQSSMWWLRLLRWLWQIILWLTL